MNLGEAKTKKETYALIRDKKMEVTIEELTEGLPKEFAMYFQHCRDLKFDEKPDYEFLRKILRDLM